MIFHRILFVLYCIGASLCGHHIFSTSEFFVGCVGRHDASWDP